MSIPDFPDFFDALHGRGPFAWQVRAARELSQSGWWPALTAPTGAGKTSLIEAWLHGLATTGSGRLGRRLFWVVDRRAVIDQVFEHADEVMTKLLADDAPPALGAVGRRLVEIGGGAEPYCALWRGGLDEAAGREARAPIDPARVGCVCSTVDQVGSRLLFRGYGIAPGSRAIHAGLAGIDAVIVLDEAHIARELCATAGAVARRQSAALRPPGPPLRVVEVTATPRREDGFALTAEERAEPAIARRLCARKRVRVAKRGRAVDAVEEARRMAKGASGAAIGVILNTVGEARAAFDVLAAEGVPVSDRTLIVGPVRPLDRAHALARVPSREERAGRTGPFFVVATQTIEVGFDLDLDGLVTACAPVVALIQRLGRLDRVGILGETAAVVLPPPRRGCPVYGEATANAWDWLRQRLAEGEVDLGPSSIERLRHEAPWPPGPAARPAPVLQESHVDALTRVEASDDESPDVELFLHGDRDVIADVGLIWRADLPTDAASQDLAGDRLALRPPHAGETLTISLAAAARWLAGKEPGFVADVPSSEVAAPEADAQRAPRTAWIVRRDGHESPEVAAVSLAADVANPGAGGGDGSVRLRPGDIVALPAEVGGADEHGWAPGSRHPVVDLGSLNPGRPRAVLRAGDGELVARDVARVHQALEEGDLSPAAAALQLAPAIRAALPDEARYAPAVEPASKLLVDGIAEPLADGAILVLARRTDARGRPAAGKIVTLADHQRDVADRVAAMARAIGLDGEISAALQLAAAHHDEGKRDPRFQAWLSAGAPAAVALAKSSYSTTRRRLYALRDAAGWPAGKRHEIASTLLLGAACADAVLATWLIATHHGANRPFPHAVDDPAASGIELATEIDGVAVSVAADAGLDVGAHLDALERLTTAHGAWGLAYLEAILVFADREISGAGG